MSHVAGWRDDVTTDKPKAVFLDLWVSSILIIDVVGLGRGEQHKSPQQTSLAKYLMYVLLGSYLAAS